MTPADRGFRVDNSARPIKLTVSQEVQDTPDARLPRLVVRRGLACVYCGQRVAIICYPDGPQPRKTHTRCPACSASICFWIPPDWAHWYPGDTINDPVGWADPYNTEPPGAKENEHD